MLETPRAPESGAKELDALLASATSREKRSRKKTILYTLVPVIFGLAFLGISLRKVSRLERTATSLNGEIGSKNAELVRKKDELSNLEAEAIKAQKKLDLATTALSDIEKGQINPQQKARQTLQTLKTRENSQWFDAGRLGPGFNHLVISRVYEGTLSLGALELAVKDAEANLLAELESLAAGQSGGRPVNHASFREVSASDVRFGHFFLMPAGSGGALSGNRKRIFESTIYVEGEKMRIEMWR